MPSLTPADTATQLTAWSDELLALEAIYPDLLTHDDGCADAAAIAEAAAAADAFTADSSSDGAPACVEVSFTVLLDGGGVIDVSDSAMPPGEVRLQIGLRPGYPHKGVLPKIALVHEMLTDVRLLSGSNLSQRTRSRRHARARVRVLSYACIDRPACLRLFLPMARRPWCVQQWRRQRRRSKAYARESRQCAATRCAISNELPSLHPRSPSICFGQRAATRRSPRQMRP